MRKTKKSSFITFLQLARYSTNARTEAVLAGAFLIGAFAMEFAMRGKNVVGGVFLVASSTYKKKLQIHYPYLFLIPTVLVLYTLLVLVHSWMISHPMAGMTISQNYSMQTSYILTLGIYLFLGEIYFGFCYKYYLQASGILIFVVMPVAGFLNAAMNYDIWAGKSLLFSITAGYLFVIVGLVLSVVFSNICYKKPLSITAFKGIWVRK